MNLQKKRFELKASDLGPVNTDSRSIFTIKSNLGFTACWNGLGVTNKKKCGSADYLKYIFFRLNW